MIGDLTPHRIANDIRMLRSHHTGSFLIVEGDTDTRLFKNLVDSQKCHVQSAMNKDMALKVLDILEQDKFAGVLAIVDADFWHLEGTKPQSSNLVLTDTHDLETMILKSPALEKVLAEFGSENKIKTVPEKFKKDIRRLIIEAGVCLGYLRWISLQENLSLKFEGLSFNKFVDDKTLIVDEYALIKAVKNNSQKPSLDERDIQRKIQKLKKEGYDGWCVCRGHDLMKILSIALCKLLGTNDTTDVKSEQLEKVLRVAYERAYFCQTKLYTAIQEWEKVNQPFQIIFTGIEATLDKTW
ncbi:MAG TPA: DUF4435 domain-containing protein [Halomicronema sp.]